MTSIKDISAECGVSIATVSKALNGHKDVSPETREKVQAVARRLGYSPNAAAKALKTNRTHNIGVLFVDQGGSGFTHDYFAYILESFKRTAERRGYDITFVNTSKDGKRTMSFLDHCRYRGFDGIALVCVDFTDPEAVELLESDFPVVALDYVYNGRISIMSDNAKGIRDLIEYVYDKGHRRIAYVCDNGESAVTQNRVSSFHNCCNRLGLKIPDEYIVGVPYKDTTAAFEATEALLNLPEPPTCILYCDDFTSFGGVNAIRKRNLRIPEDISIAGYDGISLVRHIEPKLTTIRQDTDKLGGLTAEKLIELIENPKSTIIEQVIVSGQLYEGETVAQRDPNT